MTTSSRRTTADGRPLYKLRRNGKSGGYSISIPGEIAKMIPQGTQFAFELTEDGFAYSIVAAMSEDGLPEWLTKLESVEH